MVDNKEAKYSEPIIGYLEPELKDAFVLKVKQDDRTESSAIRMLVRRYVDGEISTRKDD